MTASINGTTDELVVVHVKDAVSSILAGRGDVSYQSPPLPPEEAMTLVRLLLGHGGSPEEGEVSWRCPIAGGQRTITIKPPCEAQTHSPTNAARPSGTQCA
ncbi:MAG: hypothetical protein ACXVII_33505 [Solirubrobacteraceae bacterium]